MPSPRGQELGIKSPKRLRGGIDFSTWEGLNLENDAGAIRDTQFTQAINVRINGNEIFSRGGQEKIHTQALDGCVYGMIDVPEGATSLLLVANQTGVLPNATGSLDRYYSEATPVYNEIFPVGLTPPSVSVQGLPGNSVDFNFNEFPRRSLARANGNAYQFGKLDDGVTSVFGLFKIILPDRSASVSGDNSVTNQAKREFLFLLPEFASWTTIKENIDESEEADATVQEVLYIGSRSLGVVYRWDGITLSTEDSNLPSTRHMVVTYADDVWAIADNKLRKRNGGLWNIEFTLPATKTPNAATEYGNLLIIASEDTLYIFNGSTFSSHVPFSTFTSLCISDVKAFNGLLYYCWTRIGASPPATLGWWDGTTFHDNVFAIGGESSTSGCLEPSGNYLYMTSSDDTGGPVNARLIRINPGANDPVTTTTLDVQIGIGTQSDLMAF